MEIVDESNCTMCNSNPDGDDGPIALDKDNKARLCTGCYKQWILTRDDPQKLN